jgi:hypothetical protein
MTHLPCTFHIWDHAIHKPFFSVFSIVTFINPSTQALRLSILVMTYMTPARGLAIVILLLALYCGLDPFKHSPIRGFPDFEVYKVNLPSWSEVPGDCDKDNLLQKSEILFENQVHGPESIVFDRHGHGPYTGVADGRILFWNGQAWTDFAYTSPNRSHLSSFLIFPT